MIQDDLTTKEPERMAILYDYLGRDVVISKNIDGWEPPDTKELRYLCEQLNYISGRLFCLAGAVLTNYARDRGLDREALQDEKRREKEALKKQSFPTPKKGKRS